MAVRAPAYCVLPNFFSSSRSSSQSASGGHAGRCRALRNAANPRRDFSSSAPPSGSLAFTAWRQTVLAMVCSPSRAKIHLTPRPPSIHPRDRAQTARVRRLHERRQRVEQERALAKFAQPHAQPGQRGQLLAQKNRVPRRQFNGLRSNSFCDGAAPFCSSRFSICSNNIRSCAACWSSRTSPRSDSSTA